MSVVYRHVLEKEYSVIHQFENLDLQSLVFQEYSKNFRINIIIM